MSRTVVSWSRDGRMDGGEESGLMAAIDTTARSSGISSVEHLARCRMDWRSKFHSVSAHLGDPREVGPQVVKIFTQFFFVTREKQNNFIEQCWRKFPVERLLHSCTIAVKMFLLVFPVFNGK